MLPIVLIFFVATGALAAPQAPVTQANITETQRIPDSGSYVNGNDIDRVFESVNRDETNIYILIIQQILNDFANQPDLQSQIIAVGTAIAALGELATGIEGDVCADANLIDAFAAGGGSSALGGWANTILKGIDNIALRNVNPEAVRGANGSRGKCAGGGRSYHFQEAWDVILSDSSLSSSTRNLLNQEYSAAKRLYDAPDIRSNNVAAAVTAAATLPARAAFQQALPQLANFLKDVAAGSNPARSAGIAKAAVKRAVANV